MGMFDDNQPSTADKVDRFLEKQIGIKDRAVRAAACAEILPVICRLGAAPAPARPAAAASGGAIVRVAGRANPRRIFG